MVKVIDLRIPLTLKTPSEDDNSGLHKILFGVCINASVNSYGRVEMVS